MPLVFWLPWQRGCHYNINYDIKMICNKILGKVTKFGEKRTKTLGVMAN